MQIKNLIRIRKAKRKDARAERIRIIPKGYYEALERIMIETGNATDASKFQVAIDKACSIYARSINYKREVLKAIESAYHDYSPKSTAGDLEFLTFMRTYQSHLQKEIESAESMQSFSKLLSKWRNGKISGERILDSSKNLIGGLRYAN